LNDIRIISIADRKYYKYLRTMVNSVNINLPGVKVHAYLVNMSDKEGERLQEIHPNLEYTIEEVKFKFELQKKCYCTNRRSYILHKLREETDDILVWLDADSLVVKPCPEFLDFVRECDISYRPKNKSDLTAGHLRRKLKPQGYMAGVIIVGTSAKALEFTKEYDRLLSRTSYTKARLNHNGPIHQLPKMLKKIWMSNQDLLSTLRKKFKNDINFVPLPQKYLDCSFSPDTAIWSVKHSNRKDKKFDEIFQKYKIAI